MLIVHPFGFFFKCIELHQRPMTPMTLSKIEAAVVKEKRTHGAVSINLIYVILSSFEHTFTGAEELSQKMAHIFTFVNKPIDKLFVAVSALLWCCCSSSSQGPHSFFFPPPRRVIGFALMIFIAPLLGNSV